MSLESKIEDLTAAVHALVAAMGQRPVQAATVAPVLVPAPVPAPVPALVPAAAPVVAAAMPAPPTFAAVPAAPPAAVSVPFTDQKSLITYVMGAYSALGPTKGAQIQGVLTSLGCANINDVKNEQYAALFAGVEALKG